MVRSRSQCALDLPNSSEKSAHLRQRLVYLEAYQFRLELKLIVRKPEEAAWTGGQVNRAKLPAIYARSARAVLTGPLPALWLVLLTSSSHAQTLPCETSGNPNEILVFEQMRVPRWLAETVVRAAQVTGVDPAYMMALADKESSRLPDNKARTSSAEGLFQFIEGTWLEVLRRYGPKHGYVAEAEAIQIVQGRPVISDESDRERILNLRSTPYLSALMAGEMINTHRETLAGKVERDPSFAELYMAHFLGVNGASRFVALLSDEPDNSAPNAFPRAAKANRALFFASKTEAARKTKALSVAEVQERIGAMINKRVVRYASVRAGLGSSGVGNRGVHAPASGSYGANLTLASP